MGGPRSETTSASARHQNPQFGSANVHEYAPVAEDNDDEWQEHADGDVKDSVPVRQRAVPQTLLRLAVERVRRPTHVARHVERHADRPRRGDDGEARATSEETSISGVVADVDETVDADAAYAKQRHDAAGDTEAGAERAQPLATVVEQ